MPEAKPTLLIVDDTPDNVLVLNGILSKEYTLYAAPTGERALALARTSPPPDLILLDVMMPVMDGYEVCRRLKSDPLTSSIPVIFVTAKCDETDETKGFSLGAVDYITKPVKPPVVLIRVATHLKIRKMQLELERKNLDLEKAAELRDDVERITRHDLKSPLNSIIAIPRILAEKNVLSDDGDVQLLRTVERCGRKMLNMINRSLDLYKMEVGGYELAAQPMDILPMIQGVMEEALASPVAKGKRGLLRLEGLPVKSGDEFWSEVEEMLSYPMFSNLILNAFEASSQGQVVEVDLESRDSEALVKITNNGLVPEAIRSNFFEKYVTRGKQGGTGLGTYSARLCAETQKGSISMDVLDGERTRITVSLPAIKKRMSTAELKAHIAKINDAVINGEYNK